MRRGQHPLDKLSDLRADVTTQDGVAGVLRVACLPTFGKRHVLPVVDELLSLHPDLRVEFSFEELPPVMDRYDVVIRIGDLADSSLVGVRLATRRVCSSRLGPTFDASPPHGRLADLAAHHLIEELSRSGYLG